MNKKYKDLLTDIIKKGHPFFISVKGNSMFPTIKDGDMVKIIPQKEYSIGTIVAYMYEGGCGYKIIVHRIVAMRKKCYYLKGDNNTKCDYPIKFEDILGAIVH